MACPCAAITLVLKWDLPLVTILLPYVRGRRSISRMNAALSSHQTSPCSSFYANLQPIQASHGGYLDDAHIIPRRTHVLCHCILDVMKVYAPCLARTWMDHMHCVKCNS